MLTVDACVWVAAYDPQDRFRRDSVVFLSAAMRRRTRLVAPAIMPLEVACVLARRAGSPEVGESASRRLRTALGLQLLAVDEKLLALATRLGTKRLLRGADALYAAVAEATRSPLITWDSALLERARGRTPEDWLTGTG